jgi:NMD protein affecting ribosome stability and mRNA decay
MELTCAQCGAKVHNPIHALCEECFRKGEHYMGNSPSHHDGHHKKKR